MVTDRHRGRSTGLLLLSLNEVAILRREYDEPQSFLVCSPVMFEFVPAYTVQSCALYG